MGETTRVPPLLPRLVSLCARSLTALAVTALVFLHPYVAGEWYDLTGRPDEALDALRTTPAWLVPDSRLQDLAAEARAVSAEQVFVTRGVRVSFEPSVHDARTAVTVARHARDAHERLSRFLGYDLPAVSIRLPRWSRPALLGAYDYVDVALSPEALADPAVLPHELGHFGWFRSQVGRPLIPLSHPLWLDEGLAFYLGEHARPGGNFYVPGAFAARTPAGLETLDTLVAFHDEYLRPGSFVEYLVRLHGLEAFRGFARSLRLGSGTWEALGRGTGCWPEDVVDHWKSDFRARYDRKTPVDSGSARRVVAPVETPRGQGTLPPQRPGPALPVDRGLPPAGDLLLVALAASGAVALARRVPLLAWARSGWPLVAAAVWLAAFLGNRLFWGLAMELAAGSPGWCEWTVPYVWRYRGQWLGDFLLIASLAWWFGRAGTRASPMTTMRAFGWAGFAALAAALLPGTTWGTARPLEPWLAAAVLLQGLRSVAEAGLFAGVLIGRGPSRLRLLAAGMLYALWTVGPQAPAAAWLFRASLLVLAWRAGSPGAVLAGWDLVAGILLCRETTALGKLGWVRSWGALAGPEKGAWGLDAIWTVALLAAAGAMLAWCSRPRSETSGQLRT